MKRTVDGVMASGSMTFSVVTTGGRALGIFILPLWKNGFYHPPLWKKGGEGGFEKANKERRDIELLVIYKISPDPSLLKRETQLVPDIFITPLGKGALIFPPFSTTLFVIEPWHP
jgi:hypothetical protein